MTVESLLAHVMGRRVTVVLREQPEQPPNGADAGDPSSGRWIEQPATWLLGDPYGPDPVVFGHVPRVRGS